MLRNVKHYHRPGTIEDAVSLVQSTPNAVYLAGGAWIALCDDPGPPGQVDGMGGRLDQRDRVLDRARTVIVLDVA